MSLGHWRFFGAGVGDGFAIGSGYDYEDTDDVLSVSGYAYGGAYTSYACTCCFA